MLVEHGGNILVVGPHILLYLFVEETTNASN
jgi:hypothetical protein